jgi:transposase-like protein
MYRAARQLGLHPNTAYRWMHKARLGVPPYAELMFPVIAAVQSWKTNDLNPKVPENPLGLTSEIKSQARPSNVHEKARKSGGLVLV